MKIGDIAKVCHEANKAYCEAIGDNSQLPWDKAEQWQRNSAIAGVKFKLDHPEAKNSAQHDAWVKDKLIDGWKYGPVKNSSKKEHPCIGPYEQLPEEQKGKDALFVNIVEALKSLIN